MISCEQYDYIEIACLYHYPIQLTLASGAIVEGIAINTKQDSERGESIILKAILSQTSKDEGTEQVVPLNTVVSMKALLENPHFEVIYFQQVTA